MFSTRQVADSDKHRDSKRFEVKTADAAISIEPEHSYLVEARVIDGKKYLLIPAGEGLEVNGMPVDWVD